MRKLILLLILMPVLAFSQQKKQQRVCVPSRTQVINCCCDSPKVVVNVAPSSQLVLEPDLKQAIIEKLKEKKKSDFWETILKWLAAVSPIFLAWLAYVFARWKSKQDHQLAAKQSTFDNLLKADMEWIKDFRNLGSDVLSGLQGIQILQAIYFVRKEEFEDAELAYDNFLASKGRITSGPSQEQINMNEAKSKMNEANDELMKKYRESIKPLMEFKICLSETESHGALSRLIDHLNEKMKNLEILSDDEINSTISLIRAEVARTRTEIKNRA